MNNWGEFALDTSERFRELKGFTPLNVEVGSHGVFALQSNREKMRRRNRKMVHSTLQKYPFTLLHHHINTFRVSTEIEITPTSMGVAETDYAIWTFPTSAFMIKSRIISLKSLDLLFRSVNQEPPNGGGTWEYFNSMIDDFQLVLVKLMVHPRRDDILSAWNGLFCGHNDDVQATKCLAFAQSIGLVS